MELFTEPAFFVSGALLRPVNTRDDITRRPCNRSAFAQLTGLPTGRLAAGASRPEMRRRESLTGRKPSLKQPFAAVEKPPSATRKPGSGKRKNVTSGRAYGRNRK